MCRRARQRNPHNRGFGVRGMRGEKEPGSKASRATTSTAWGGGVTARTMRMLAMGNPCSTTAS